MQCIIRGMENDTQLVIRMPAELKARLVLVADIRRASLSDMVRQCLVYGLNHLEFQEDAIDD